MALNCVLRRGCSLNLRQIIQLQQTVASSSASVPSVAMSKIGTREVVGFGLNGEPNYVDRIDIPMPGIRFKEETADIKVLREKEKSDWKKLSVEEKKALYRFSFCQTLAEVTAPNGDWKRVIGLTFMAFSTAIWVYVLMKLFVYPPLPDSFKPEKQQAQLQRMIDLRIDPITGLGSKYDYEKGKWKD